MSMASVEKKSTGWPTKPDDTALATRLFDEIAAFSADVAGISRPAFSDIETRTLKYLETFAREQGLCVEFDAGQNAVFCLPEDEKASAYVLIGSHVDTVPYGGNFDGLAGVIAGLICLVRAKRQKAGFARPVKVIAMRAEESAWFGPCYIASKALLGKLGEEELQSRHKGDGRSLDAHMAAIGIDMLAVRKKEPLFNMAAVQAYIELHIEQGPLLVEKNLPAAVVSGIRGNVRHRKIRCIGEAGHSGAVPRAYRKDPVLAMADLLTRLDESWLTILQKGEDLVLTCGIVKTDPEKHAMTRIPDSVEFSIDYRSQSAKTLDEMRELLQQEMATVSKERNVLFEVDPEMQTLPALCDKTMVDELTAAMSRVNLEPFVMPSGGGHDTAVFANAGIPSAMVFVRNENGSHNPDEAMEIPDLIAGVDIICEYLKEPSR